MYSASSSSPVFESSSIRRLAKSARGRRCIGLFRRDPLQDLRLRFPSGGAELGAANSDVELRAMSSRTLPRSSTRCRRVGFGVFGDGMGPEPRVVRRELLSLLPRISTASLKDTDRLDFRGRPFLEPPPKNEEPVPPNVLGGDSAGNWVRFTFTTHPKNREPKVSINSWLALLAGDFNLDWSLTFLGDELGGGVWVRERDCKGRFLDPFCSRGTLMCILGTWFGDFCFLSGDGVRFFFWVAASPWSLRRGRPRFLVITVMVDTDRAALVISLMVRRRTRTWHSLSKFREVAESLSLNIFCCALVLVGIRLKEKSSSSSSSLSSFRGSASPSSFFFLGGDCVDSSSSFGLRFRGNLFCFSDSGPSSGLSSSWPAASLDVFDFLPILGAFEGGSTSFLVKSASSSCPSLALEPPICRSTSASVKRARQCIFILEFLKIKFVFIFYRVYILILPFETFVEIM